ncbi:MAG TPA: tRNA (adenosine(37)-N6)-dimethylallyltransferase MiaA [Puia sp.]
MQEPTVIIIVGPTAVGKTAAAIGLAQSLQTKIISADSRQCYRELNIGVAKPSPEELHAVPHYFIDSHSIRQEVNAALFEELALQWTDQIFREQASSPATSSHPFPTAVMVGGTGLYIKAFSEGLDDMPPIDPAIRLQIRQLYEQNGLAGLQEEVRKLDPAWYAAGETLNPRRLMRALEVRLSTGRSILSFQTRGQQSRPFRIRKIGLQLPKEELHRRIHDRVDRMMEQGLLEEVRGLTAYRTHRALQTVGYSELFDHLEGRTSLATAVEEIKKNTRHYAKRQLTWFRKDPSIQWVDAGEPLGKALFK